MLYNRKKTFILFFALLTSVLLLNTANNNAFAQVATLCTPHRFEAAQSAALYTFQMGLVHSCCHHLKSPAPLVCGRQLLVKQDTKGAGKCFLLLATNQCDLAYRCRYDASTKLSSNFHDRKVMASLKLVAANAARKSDCISMIERSGPH
jgi:hypothetical protein